METSTDKSKELNATIYLVNQRLQFKGQVSGHEPVSIDYTPPLGDNLGYTSLELLLLSLSSCVGSALLVVLRKMQKSIIFFEIAAKGWRKQEHPTGFRSIRLDVKVQSPDITVDELKKAGELIEGLCPVLDMVKGNVEISYSFIITK